MARILEDASSSGHPNGLWPVRPTVGLTLDRRGIEVQILDRLPKGLLVQWENAWLAPRRSGFDSLAGPPYGEVGQVVSLAGCKPVA